jgi:DNA-binding XRE family transcriptional regulator
MNNNNEFYGLKLWLLQNERSQAWIAKRLQIHKVTISQWKKNNKVPHTMKLAICQVTGTTYEQLWGEV